MIIDENDYIKIMETMPVVCVDGLIVNNKKEFLLVKRNNEPLKGQYWLPGGRLHKNETLENSIKRKIYEELRCEVKIIKSLGYFEEFFGETKQNVNSGFHAISIVFLLKLLSSDILLDNQSDDWKWFSKLPERFNTYNLLNKI